MRLPAGKSISTFSKRRNKTQQRILCPQPREYAVVIPTKYKDPHGWADCVDGFIRVVQQTDKMHIVPVRAIVGPAVRGSPLIAEVVLGNRQMHSVYIVCAHTYAVITS